MVSGELANESDENQVGTSCQIGIYIIILFIQLQRFHGPIGTELWRLRYYPKKHQPTK